MLEYYDVDAIMVSSIFIDEGSKVDANDVIKVAIRIIITGLLFQLDY